MELFAALLAADDGPGDLARMARRASDAANYFKAGRRKRRAESN